MMSVMRSISTSNAVRVPVSTPPNAIVYGSGLIPMRRMIGAGVVFDVICIAVIWLALRVAVELNWTPFL